MAVKETFNLEFAEYKQFLKVLEDVSQELGVVQKDLDQVKQNAKQSGQEAKNSFSGIKGSGDELLGNLGQVGGKMLDLKGAALQFGKVNMFAAAVTGAVLLGRELQQLASQYKALGKDVQFFTGAQGSELIKQTAQVKALSDTYGKDFKETLRSVNAQAKNFKVSFEEAFVSVRRGFENGADVTDEFLQRIEEYAPQFANAGFALNDLISIAQTEAQEGVWDDKLLDSVKEIQLSLLELTDVQQKALAPLGQDFTDRLFAGLRSGTISVKEAMALLNKQIKETNLSVDQLQTLTADIGKGATEDIGGLVRVLDLVEQSSKNANEQMGYTTDETKDLTDATIDLETATAELAKELGFLDDWAKATETMWTNFKTWGVEAFTELIKQAKRWRLVTFGDAEDKERLKQMELQDRKEQLEKLTYLELQEQKKLADQKADIQYKRGDRKMEERFRKEAEEYAAEIEKRKKASDDYYAAEADRKLRDDAAKKKKYEEELAKIQAERAKKAAEDTAKAKAGADKKAAEEEKKRLKEYQNAVQEAQLEYYGQELEAKRAYLNGEIELEELQNEIIAGIRLSRAERLAEIAEEYGQSDGSERLDTMEAELELTEAQLETDERRAELKEEYNKLLEEEKELMEEINGSHEDAVDGFLQAGDALAQMFENGEEVARAFGAMQQAFSAFIQIKEAFDQRELLMSQLKEVQKKKEAAASTAAASAKAAEGAAEQAKLPFPGNIVAIASTAATILSVLASLRGFNDGGFTGSNALFTDNYGHGVVGTVHKDEFVFTSEKTRKLLPAFEAIHTGKVSDEAVMSLVTGEEAARNRLQEYMVAVSSGNTNVTIDNRDTAKAIEKGFQNLPSMLVLPDRDRMWTALSYKNSRQVKMNAKHRLT
ncbi:phage tail tape measure protein [Limibacter armeniacum]|uniref:phage tail tape measure protein n=1 Tax=Limibacter armeniacum TaxID=466084 RepID=UPI002FE53E61